MADISTHHQSQARFEKGRPFVTIKVKCTTIRTGDYSFSCAFYKRECRLLPRSSFLPIRGRARAAFFAPRCLCRSTFHIQFMIITPLLWYQHELLFVRAAVLRCGRRRRNCSSIQVIEDRFFLLLFFPLPQLIIHGEEQILPSTICEYCSMLIFFVASQVTKYSHPQMDGYC